MYTGPRGLAGDWQRTAKGGRQSGCPAANNLRSSLAMHRPEHPGSTSVDPPDAADGQRLIALAQKLARDAERHALLAASLASQADRLMVAGLRRLDRSPLPTRL